MKAVMTLLGALLVTSASFAAPVICKDKSGASVAVLFQDDANQELILSIKTETGARRSFSAMETMDGTIEGRNGLLKARPVLNTTAGVLRMAGKRISVNCAVSARASL